MNQSLCGEYDNYLYRPIEEMTLEEQIASAKRALKSAMELSKTNKNEYLEQKIIEIKQRLQQLEAELVKSGGK